MTKRVRFDENALVAEKIGKYDDTDTPSTSVEKSNLPGSRFKENHSIDSDDDDDDEEGGKRKEDYEKLTEEDVEGAENEEISGDYTEDGGPLITPFNLKEEMEEGDFDTSGHYHFKKDKEIRDNWLDNIDWVKVKKVDPQKDEPMSDEDNEAFDEIKVLEGIVQLLHKGETVTKGLRRLGGSDEKKSKKKSRSWQRESVYDVQVDEDEDQPNEKDKAQSNQKYFLQLTELADQMAGAGHYDIYTDTFEKIQHKLNSLQVSSKAAAVSIPDGTDADDALDIFADDIDTEKLESKSDNTASSQTVQTNGDEADDSVKWQYKWSDEETELFGPFTSEQMAQWKEQGYFKDGVKVRRTDRPDSAFYNVTRIDFDLYE